MPKEVSYLYRTPIWENTASLCVAECSSLVREISSRHAFTRSDEGVFARVAVCAAYLSGWIEENEHINLTVKGDGPSGAVHAFGDGRLRLCGSVENSVSEKIPPEACVGTNGYLSVVRDGGRGLPYSGACALVSGNIEEDMAAYFRESEQRPTAIRLIHYYIRDKQYCGGVFVQPLTGADESVFMRAKSSVERFSDGFNAEEVLKYYGAEKAERREITFGCTCSREKAERAILSLGSVGAYALLEAEGEIKVHCHECNADYIFNGKDLAALFKNEV